MLAIWMKDNSKKQTGDLPFNNKSEPDFLASTKVHTSERL
jgi:hypothetical protein